jgi:hypothetical protein
MMSSNDTARELEKLRADVAALSDARRENATKPVDPVPAAQDRPAAMDPVEDASVPEEQKSQLEELGDLLQAEIRDLPTITCLTVFSLGILMGRLMR